MISIKKYTDKLQYVWDDFILKSKHGTIFHQQKFLSYHILKKFRDSSLLFYKNKLLVGVFSAALVEERDGKTLMSHPGASFGGFVVLEPTYQLYNGILVAFHQYCVHNKIIKCQIVPSPCYYSIKSDNMLEYVLSINNYLLSEKYISHIIYLNHNSPLKYFNQRKQRYIKNNFLNNPSFQFKKINSPNLFYRALLETKKKFGVKPTHTLEEIKKLMLLYPNHCRLWGTFYNKKLIGGVLILFTSISSGLLFYNAVSKKYDKANIGLFQIYQSIIKCLNNNILVFDLGVSHLPNTNNPLTPKISLIEFKEQCGAVGVTRNVYTKQFDEEDYAKK